MESYKFNECYEAGKCGEEVIYDYLTSLDNVKLVSNVTNSPQHQEVDIDFLIEFKNGITSTAEVKTDSYDTGNFFIELIGDIEDNRLGCMLVTKSDYLFYFFTKTNELYIIRTRKFVTWFLMNMARFDDRTVKNNWGGNCYHSFGVLLPKKILENECKFYKKVIIKEDTVGNEVSD